MSKLVKTTRNSPHPKKERIRSLPNEAISPATRSRSPWSAMKAIYLQRMMNKQQQTIILKRRILQLLQTAHKQATQHKPKILAKLHQTRSMSPPYSATLTIMLAKRSRSSALFLKHLPTIPTTNHMKLFIQLQAVPTSTIQATVCV